MATAASPSSSMQSSFTYACIRCAERKVKCDRHRPCSACLKHHADCVFNLSRPLRKRQKRVNDQILTDRLKHYEALLQERGIDPKRTNLPDTPHSELRRRSSHTGSVIPTESQLPTPSSNASEPSGFTNKTQIVHGEGRSQFVDNSLWTRMVEEFHDPKDAWEDSSNDASDLEASDDDFSFVLSSRPKSNSRSRHPPTDRIHSLWQIFVENVDPLTKVVHVPTLRPAVQKAASNIRTIPRGFEALMFAIYSAAVMSLKDEECRQRLGEPRKDLLLRYTSATEEALGRAKFMGTISLIVLQALVLHLLSVRETYEPRAVWSLTGVAIRIAHGMGLEHDGASLGLPPFEAEMRRRLWWVLKSHDFRTAELCGLSKFRDLDTSDDKTKFPTNINDDQLYPGMPSLPDESKALADTVFIAMRYELLNFATARVARFRQQGKNSSQWDLSASGSDEVEIDHAFKAVEEILETKYVRYCDPSQPLHLMTMLVARIAMNVVRFLTHHPRKWSSLEQTPLSERQWVWEISIKLLEQHNMVQSNPQLKQFAWHAAYYLQWHAFIHMLDTLGADPLIADAEKAWHNIGNTYENNSNMILDIKKPIHVAVGNLCLKAYSAREAALQSTNEPTPPTPEFISQLRQQRKVVNAKRQARDAKSSQLTNPVRDGRANARDMDPGPDAGVVYSVDGLQHGHLQQNIMTNSPGLRPSSGVGETDPFWFQNGFDDSQVGTFNDEMEMNLDHGMENNASQAITWEQWDAFLADSNVMRPLSSKWNYGVDA